MGSAGSPNSWAPYDSYRDCSQEICSINCPQWCSMVFRPPPPFVPLDEDADSTPNFSPLIIAVIGILASAFLLTAYYTIISKYCNRTGRARDDQNPAPEFESSRDQTNPAEAAGSTGLDETLIKSIAVCKYKKGDGLVEGTECSVCLSEFQEDESLRPLPKCSHAFHLNCIDTWLKSQSNCPLCRASAVKLPPPPNTSVQTSSSTLDIISPLQVNPQNDLILVVGNDDDRDQRVHSEDEEEEEVATARQIRRTISLGSFAFRGHLLVADILHINEDDEDAQMGINRIWPGVGTSRGEGSSWQNSRNEALKRSITTGRFSFRKA